mgnify:CR=1 FL=1
MTTYMIHNNGDPVSIGTVIADPLPEGLAAVALSDADATNLRNGWQWNPATLAVDIEPAPPAPDPLTTLLAALANAQSLEEIRDAAAAAGGTP